MRPERSPETKNQDVSLETRTVWPRWQSSPHHKHVGDTVEPSTETTLEDVLQRIEKS